MDQSLRAVIFDLDGTLADTFPLIVAAWNAAVREPLGRAFAPEEVIARFGVPDSAMLRRALPAAAWERAIKTYHEYYEAEHEIVAPFPGVPEMLEALLQCGLPLGLMTGKGRPAAHITLRKLGWAGMFSSVVTGEDVSRQKPAPEGIRLVAEQLGATAEYCIYVGDMPGDIEAGRAAGMITVAAGWHGYYQDRLRLSTPDHWAEHPADIVHLCRALGRSTAPVRAA
ncbi:MAG TPA: HAD family hydrolase [Abditibacteriaceae bacterium]|nr:HAD family hydrolase [Abditibacteriaceae bacterium]